MPVETAEIEEPKQEWPEGTRFDTNGFPVLDEDHSDIEAALAEAAEEAPDSTTDDRERVTLTAEFAALALGARFSPNSRHYIRGGHQARCYFQRETGKYFVEIHKRTPNGHVRTWVEIPDTFQLIAAEDPKKL